MGSAEPLKGIKKELMEKHADKNTVSIYTQDDSYHGCHGGGILSKGLYDQILCIFVINSLTDATTGGDASSFQLEDESTNNVCFFQAFFPKPALEVYRVEKRLWSMAGSHQTH